MKKVTKRGKPTNLYLRESDIAKLRELTVYLAEQGERTSDSLIVRAALQTVTPGSALLKAYREAAGLDLRFKHE